MKYCPETENQLRKRKTSKTREKTPKKQKKEDWDEELKKEKKIPGLMKRINCENVFVADPALF